MTSRELNLRLIYAFPGLEQAYHDETSWQEGDDTGSHVVYADVFVPYILKNIKDENSLRAVFSYIEELLSEHDDYADEVVQLSVLESLNDCDALDACRRFFGKNTYQAVKNLY